MSRPPRVYSAALLVAERLNNGLAGVWRVPAGHRWVLKSLTWCEVTSNDFELQTYSMWVDIEFTDPVYPSLMTRVIKDNKLIEKRPGEWSGRLTLHEGDGLVLANVTEPWDGLHPITISVHGYDFIA